MVYVLLYHLDVVFFVIGLPRMEKNSWEFADLGVHWCSIMINALNTYLLRICRAKDKFSILELLQQ